MPILDGERRPGYTFTSSVSFINLSLIDRIIMLNHEQGKSVLLIDLANNVSPVKTISWLRSDILPRCGPACG